jgi:NAD-dependent dihydropyrimidine dehydrogenase PreA subunit
MPLREIIRIDEERCDGCGLCVPACAEGAIAVVDGKARLVSDSLCDRLGACLGHCPQGAITIERVNVAAFDEAAARGKERPPATGSTPAAFAACPGSRETSFDAPAPRGADHSGPSALRQWPVQLHLVSPDAPHFAGADVLLAADCVGYAVGAFHRDYLGGRSLAIACPKLDAHQEIYLEKLVALIDEARIGSLTVMVMEVPCCGGLVRLVQAAAARATRKASIRCLVVGVRGDILTDTTVPLVAERIGVSLPTR